VYLISVVFNVRINMLTRLKQPFELFRCFVSVLADRINGRAYATDYREQTGEYRNRFFDKNDFFKITRSQAVARKADRTALQHLRGSRDVIGHVTI